MFGIRSRFNQTAFRTGRSFILLVNRKGGCITEGARKAGQRILNLLLEVHEGSPPPDHAQTRKYNRTDK